ncbi:hypothetical protein JHW43_003791 [Diplocarpon mali]|nr:hypothetical protein JHW43_003791 [Diplocarpon mali]
MLTSAASEATRLKNLRSLSNESVHVSREVSVVASRAPTLSNLQPTINENAPAGSTSAAATGSETLDQRNSILSDKSWIHSRGPSAQSRRRSRAPTMPESNRDSTRELSDFLMTREPPPNNFMSIPSDDEKSQISLRRGAIKLFRKRRKNAKAQRFMQLPDSAVAAWTRSGARHIAISIPMEHDWPEGTGPSRTPNPLRSHPPQKSPVETGGTVTVLKPVKELWDSASYLAKDPRISIGPVDSEISPSSPDFTPTTVNFGPDFNILSAFNPELTSSRPRGDSSPAIGSEPQRSQNHYAGVGPVEIPRQDSQRSEQRHSVGTVLSQVSLVTDRNLRQVGSVSTPPGATRVPGMKLGLPPRRSSISKVPKHPQREHAHACSLVNEKFALEERLASSRKSGDSGGTSPTSPAVFGVAVRGYNASPIGRANVVRRATPKLSVYPSPSKDLPCLPVPSSPFVSRPSIAAPFRTQAIAARSNKEMPVRAAASSRDGTEESILVTRQSRQERVRSRKLHDIEDLRVLSENRRPLSDSRGTSTNISKDPTQSQAYIVAPPRSSKRGIKSPAAARSLAALNTLSPIMLVANLPPYTGFVTASDLPLYTSAQGPTTRPPTLSKAKTKLKSKCSSSQSTHRSKRTPLHSTSSDSDVPTPVSALSKRCSPTQSLRSSVLDTRRQERRAKRNMSLREKDMDARIEKIERDNEVLLKTLGTIAKRFEKIARVGGRVDSGYRGYERENEGPGSEVWRLSDEEERRTGGLEPIEGFMRGLETAAPTRIRGEKGDKTFQKGADGIRSRSWFDEGY